MSRLNIEALAFCLVWIIVVMAGWILAGAATGLALAIGLFSLVTLSSALIFAKSGNITLERGVRWGILVAAAIGLLVYADIA